MENSGSGTNRKRKHIEAFYQKREVEHILLRPHLYIGAIEMLKKVMWVYDKERKQMRQKEISYVPGLYRIFDEILVNATDNKLRDANTTRISIYINQKTNTISIWNNGKGIPGVMHKEENMYVPTMIFGHLHTSTNFNDEEKFTGGRNGFGAKLCNMFSTKFTIETASRAYKSCFKQTWSDNMTKISEPVVKYFNGDDYTKVTFSPDLAKFNMKEMDDDIVAVLSKRAYDVAASLSGVVVLLNDEKVPVTNFKDYVDLYLDEPTGTSPTSPKVAYEKVNEHWEVALTLSEKGFQQVSFVNSIATTDGGHIDYVVDPIVKQLTEVLRNENDLSIEPYQVKRYMWIFINCLIVNPVFATQKKEGLTMQAKRFGSKCVLSDKFMRNSIKCGIIESIVQWEDFKAFE